MADNGKQGRKGEAQLLVALAGGATVRAAARVAGIGERTAYRHLESPGFRQRVLKARGDLVDSATGRLARASTAAADTLRRLLVSKDQRIRLAASRAILRLLTHMRDHDELVGRIEMLEAAVSNGRRQ